MQQFQRADLLRRAVAAVDPHVPLYDMLSQAAEMQFSYLPQLILARVAPLFGGLALALAAIGLYGLVAFNVARRTAEIGVRITLGAGRAAVVAMVLRQSLALVAIGALLGLPLALLAGHVVGSLLFRVQAADPVSFAAATLILLAAAALAAVRPAWRAAGIDPVRALRRH